MDEKEAQRIQEELAEMYKRFGVPPMKNEKNQKQIDRRTANRLRQAMELMNDHGATAEDILKAGGLL